jgi:2-amino-4-hydroxy-6-hydroxymethyldihydropteridine diphosphokinase
MKTETVVLSLGSNMGLREQHLLEAAILLDRTGCICVKRLSSLFESEPVGVETSSQFINACCIIETTLEPGELLGVCTDLERRAGRERGEVDRPLDIDIVVFGEREIAEPDLVIPHPRFRDRRFVIEPLAEIMPDLELPPDGKRPRELVSASGCRGLVRRVSSRAFAEGV